MYEKLRNFLVEQIATVRSSSLRNRVLDILGGPRVEIIYKYQLGQTMQDKISAESGDTARTYRITGRRLSSGQTYYRLVEAATAVDVGEFHEDSIEAYDPLPDQTGGETG